MGETWHVELFEGFCEPAQPPLPVLIDSELEADLKPFRRFRHIAHHGYGFQLKWERMREGVQRSRPVFERFAQSVTDFLESLPQY